MYSTAGSEIDVYRLTFNIPKALSCILFMWIFHWLAGVQPDDVYLKARWCQKLLPPSRAFYHLFGLSILNYIWLVYRLHFTWSSTGSIHTHSLRTSYYTTVMWWSYYKFSVKKWCRLSRPASELNLCSLNYLYNRLNRCFLWRQRRDMCRFFFF